MKSISLALVLVSSLCASAGALATEDVAAQTKTAPCAKIEGAPQPGACLTADQILQRIHHTNLGEITQANLALKNTKNETVVSFAKMMIDEHTKADKKAADIAGAKSLALKDKLVPLDDAEKKELREEEKTLAMLKKQKGARFDREYINTQVLMHEKVLKKLDLFEKSTDDADVLAFVRELRPTVTMHRDHAKEALAQLTRG